MTSLKVWARVVNLDKRGSLADSQKKNLRIDGESACGWLNWNPKSLENNPKNTQKQRPTENQKNAKTEI